jgi:hypothetical protein
MRELHAVSPSLRAKIKEYSDTNTYGNVNEIVIPITEGELPEHLREFIEKDPTFIPEINSKKFDDIMIQNNILDSTDQTEMLLTTKSF